MSKKIKVKDIKGTPELEQGVGEEIAETVNTSSEVKEPSEEIVALSSLIAGIEILLSSLDFKSKNTHSHRILSATLNMFKSAKDHLGK